MTTRIDLIVGLASALVAACAAPTLSLAADSAMDIDAGRQLYMQKGCFECHGMLGQGSILSGAALAPNTIPADAMTAYIRNPKGQMPDYSEKLLSNDEIVKIHAFLASIPPNPKADSIALLRGTPSPGPTASQGAAPKASPATTHGAAVYAANCAACHGRAGEGGGIGPALAGISGKYSTAQIEARIRQPLGAMPKLFPAPLNTQDVQDVARYVATMK